MLCHLAHIRDGLAERSCLTHHVVCICVGTCTVSSWTAIPTKQQGADTPYSALGTPQIAVAHTYDTKLMPPSSHNRSHGYQNPRSGALCRETEKKEASRQGHAKAAVAGTGQFCSTEVVNASDAIAETP